MHSSILPDILDCLVQIFVDDTQIYSTVDDLAGKLQLQENTKGLFKWSDYWQIKFNDTKCKVLHVGENNPNFKYCRKNVELDEIASEKELGVIVDPNLCFETQKSEAIKANRLCGMLMGSLQCKNKEAMIP